MKKYFAISILLLSFVFQATAQTRGVKIGFIDMEYILQNVPDYTEAKNQLEQKAQKWKQDIEAKKVEIAKLKDALKTERALLTRELIDEREEEIKFQETELLDFQQKKFGPNGDLMTQKAVLVKPIQDQVFNAVQDIAELKKYDYIFDKSSDLTMLFAAKRHDISDQVVRAITRAEKRQQMSDKQLKAEQAKEELEDAVEDNPALAARKKALDEKKAAREKLVADRKAAAEAKKKEQEEKRKQAAADKEAKKNGTVPANDKTTDKPATEKSTDSTKTTETKEDKAAARAKLLEDRKKAADERRKKNN
jgi:Skp family chaperone for outer membrane proteins